MQKPNILLLGPSRSGTTSLFYLLRQHPEVFAPSIKEPKYFTSKLKVNPRNGPGDKLLLSTVIQNRSQYLALYDRVKNERYAIDASSDYFFYFDSIKDDLKSFFSRDTKVIVILRDPAERAYSAYMNLIRDGRCKYTFQEYEKNQGAWQHEGYDQMWLGFYGSLYSKRIRSIKEIFPNVKVLSFAKFSSNAQGVMNEVLEFLELDSMVFRDIDVKYSRGAALSRFKHSFNRENLVMSKLRDFIVSKVGRHRIELMLHYLFQNQEQDTFTISAEWKKRFITDTEELRKDGFTY